MSSANNHTLFIKKTATDLGFDYCGISKAVFLNEDARRLETWLQKGMHGNMQYMENYFDLRVDPAKLVPGAKSVITLLLNYFPEKEQPVTYPKIAKYAYGEDYHDVIREKLMKLIELIRFEVGEVNGRGFVDSAPVLERTWAQKSGLGWKIGFTIPYFSMPPLIRLTRRSRKPAISIAPQKVISPSPWEK